MSSCPTARACSSGGSGWKWPARKLSDRVTNRIRNCWARTGQARASTTFQVALPACTPAFSRAGSAGGGASARDEAFRKNDSTSPSPHRPAYRGLRPSVRLAWPASCGRKSTSDGELRFPGHCHAVAGHQLAARLCFDGIIDTDLAGRINCFACPPLPASPTALTAWARVMCSPWIGNVVMPRYRGDQIAGVLCIGGRQFRTIAGTTRSRHPAPQP